MSGAYAGLLALKVLKGLEWSDNTTVGFDFLDYGYVGCCPVCGEKNWADYGGYEHLHRGHKEYCMLSQAIEELGK